MAWHKNFPKITNELENNLRSFEGAFIQLDDVDDYITAKVNGVKSIEIDMIKESENGKEYIIDTRSGNTKAWFWGDGGKVSGNAVRDLTPFFNGTEIGTTHDIPLNSRGIIKLDLESVHDGLVHFFSKNDERRSVKSKIFSISFYDASGNVLEKFSYKNQSLTVYGGVWERRSDFL